MALKGPRTIIETDNTLQCMSATERGVVLMISTAGSGVDLGDFAGQADLVGPSGFEPAGLLLNDIVTIDETRFHRNWHQLVQTPGERSSLLRKGRVITNMIASGVSPAAGDTAYVTTSNKLTNTVSSTGGIVATPKVGKFHSKKDENGYATVDINLPIA
jgi:hypothetical protein